jgi:hypothetical protein
MKRVATEVTEMFRVGRAVLSSTADDAGLATEAPRHRATETRSHRGTEMFRPRCCGVPRETSFLPVWRSMAFVLRRAVISVAILSLPG